MSKQPAVYIPANRRNGTLYIGVTSNLQKRAWEHKNDLVEGFTNRYGVHRLVYYELHEEMVSAIRREKQMNEEMESGLEAGTDRAAKSRLEGFVGRDCLRE
jgi:putative endonuclease